MSIQNMAKGAPLKSVYSVLEQTFLQCVQVLYQGHSLVLNTQMYLASATALQKNPDNQPAAQAVAQAQGGTS